MSLRPSHLAKWPAIITDRQWNTTYCLQLKKFKVPFSGTSVVVGLQMFICTAAVKRIAAGAVAHCTGLCIEQRVPVHDEQEEVEVTA